MTHSKIKLHQNWLPQEESTPTSVNFTDLRTVCALLVGDCCGRTHTSQSLEFFQASVANVLKIDAQKLKQLEQNPDALAPWLDSLSESDDAYISYIKYLMALVQQKVFDGQYDALPTIVQESFQCQDWLKIAQSN